MAEDSHIPTLTSFSTAVVILPPPHLQERLNTFRNGNDKSFPRWTSHLTLVFPFVEPNELDTACSLIREKFSRANLSPFRFALDKVGRFQQREYDTIYLGASNSTDIHNVWSTVSSIFHYSGRDFVPHLTLGQAHRNDNSGTFLNDKGRLLLQEPIEWEVHSVIVLKKSESEGGEMKLYQEIPFAKDSSKPSTVITGLKPTTYRFESPNWTPLISPEAVSPKPSINIATYNVLHDPRYSSAARFPRLIETLLSVSPVPDIVFLQEVTDSFLRGLLSDSRVQSRWPICTHDRQGVLPNEWNIVCLARDGFKFVWESVQLRNHKPAVVFQISREEESPIIVSAIHLKAGLRMTHHAAKLQELETLLAHLRRRFPNSPWIIAGDFNLSVSQALPSHIVEIFDDAWLSVHGSEVAGETYDPSTNAIAAQTVKDDRTPQRYDRVWVRHGHGVTIGTAELFGKGEDVASDHYGLATSLIFSDSVNEPAPERIDSKNATLVALRSNEDQSTEGQLEALLLREGGFPSPSQQVARANVVPVLKTFLTLPTPSVNSDVDEEQEIPAQRASVVKFEIVPVGSFGLSIDTESSDVDILVVGNISRNTFWSLVLSLLRKAASKQEKYSDAPEEHSIVLKRFVRDASVPMMELLVGGVAVDLQYCPAASVVERWSEIAILPRTDPLFLLPAPTLRTLNAYRWIHSIQRVIPVSLMPVFRLAYRALKIHCVSEGIYSAKFGYLSGIHLTILMTRIAVLSPPDASAEHLLQSFFATYTGWDWANHAITVPGLNEDFVYTRAQSREPMVILSLEKPTFNLVQYANQHTLAAIVSSFERTQEQLASGRSWSAVSATGDLYGNGFQSAMELFDKVIKIELSYWCPSTVKARAWVSFVQSRLQNLLVSLQAIPSSVARLWPARLADATNPGDSTNGLQSFYLIGFKAPSHSTLDNKLQTTLWSFEDQLRRDERFYDATEMFVSVTLVEHSQLPAKIVAPPEWLDGGIDPLEDGSSDSEPERFDEHDDLDSSPSTLTKLRKKSKNKKLKEPPTSSIPSPKLRISADIYNRILWDREFNTDDYLIGYEDRFTGLMEMPLTSWKRDTQHEEFVPFHRVMHFRRKTDGVLVWDRRKKIDLIFGSGVQSS
ncbi:hypothetical protein M422DRAFT_238346 [Sphaerobolus stellatus SS14]|nr:hypothetical protein M422DRAFT_238346 [Sphaerobolus stellatus SS14]